MSGGRGGCTSRRAYLIVNVVDDQVRVTGIGGSAFLVFGNVVTKKLSNEVISKKTF